MLEHVYLVCIRKPQDNLTYRFDSYTNRKDAEKVVRILQRDLKVGYSFIKEEDIQG